MACVRVAPGGMGRAGCGCLKGLEIFSAWKHFGRLWRFKNTFTYCTGKGILLKMKQWNNYDLTQLQLSKTIINCWPPFYLWGPSYHGMELSAEWLLYQKVYKACETSLPVPHLPYCLMIVMLLVKVNDSILTNTLKIKKATVGFSRVWGNEDSGPELFCSIKPVWSHLLLELDRCCNRQYCWKGCGILSFCQSHAGALPWVAWENQHLGALVPNAFWFMMPDTVMRSYYTLFLWGHPHLP